MFDQQQKMQDAFYDQYEMDLTFSQIRVKTVKDEFGTDGQSVYNIYGLNSNLDQYCSFNIAEG